MESPSEKSLKIGQLARLTGKTVRAIHYYEELGLLQPAVRSEGGFRLFAPRDVQKVNTISALQDFGLTLTQIQELFQAWREGKDGNEAAHRMAKLFHQKLKETRETIARLQEAEAQIVESLRFIADCMSCAVKPEIDTCTTCEVGDHQCHVPSLMESLLDPGPDKAASH